MDEGVYAVVVIPTYNEAATINQVVTQVLDIGVPNLYLLIVDDGSPDGTADIVQTIAEKDNRVMVHNRGVKKGLGSAYYDGFRLALKLNPKIVLSMDADGSHPAELIPQLIGAVEKGADVAVASRYISGGKWASGHGRLLVSRGANLLARIATGSKLRDMTSGMRAYSSQALKAILDKEFEPGYVFQVDVLYRLIRRGFKIVEVPMVFKRREKGKSKLSYKEILRFMAWATKTYVQRIFGG